MCDHSTACMCAVRATRSLLTFMRLCEGARMAKTFMAKTFMYTTHTKTFAHTQTNKHTHTHTHTHKHMNTDVAAAADALPGSVGRAPRVSALCSLKNPEMRMSHPKPCRALPRTKHAAHNLCAASLTDCDFASFFWASFARLQTHATIFAFKHVRMY
jgi:hypothetical protein